MANYTWVISGPQTRELTQAAGRRLDFLVDGAASARFTISGRSEEALAVVEFESDLTVYRDSEKIFRGRVVSSQDAVTESGHTTTFLAKDYRGLLEYRNVGPSGLTWTGVDQGVIAWELIDHTQSKVSGSLGITNGLGATSGQVRTRAIAPGTGIGVSLTSLGHLQGGFEWEIDEQLAFNRYYSRRGVNNGVQLDYGGALSTLNRSQTPDFANVAQVVGSNVTTATEVSAASLATDTRGRWEIAKAYPTVTEQATVDARAAWLLGETATARPGYSAKMTQGRWEGRNQMWLGDTVGLKIKSGRLSESSDQRLVTLGIDVSDEGSETVYLGLINATT